MDTRKSQFGDYFVGLYGKMCEDLEGKYQKESLCLKRDMLTIRERVASEGVSFLTKTLPKLGKALDESLETGSFRCPREFARAHGRPALPALFQGLLGRLFSLDGSLDRHLDPGILKDTRTLLFLAYKLVMPFSQSDIKRAEAAFVSTERELTKLEVDCSDPVVLGARDLLERLFRDFNPKDVVPRHGPGSVATGEKLEGKWVFTRLYNSIHQLYPYYEYFVAGGAREIKDREEWYRNLVRLNNGESKVIFVPKDSRGPRTISAEPLEYQYIQQGLARKIVSHLESHELTKGRINFKDQKVNGQLALESSTHGYYATLDLKDASDRVSCKLVKALFPDTLIKYLEACRTHSTRLPSGRVVQLSKFAPMGSALCFPVEALCFWAISVSALKVRGFAHGDPLSDVYVYGDDIIVPAVDFCVVTEALEKVGLVVNRTKSFKNGMFRESCGIDAYNGVDVTPLRIRNVPPSSPSDATGFASYSAYANAFLRDGWRKAADYVWETVERTYGRVPFGTDKSAYPCRIIESAFKALTLNIQHGFDVRLNPDTHSVEVRAKYLSPQKKGSTLDGWPRLLRNFCYPNNERPSEVVVPRTTKVRRGWRRV